MAAWLKDQKKNHVWLRFDPKANNYKKCQYLEIIRLLGGFRSFSGFSAGANFYAVFFAHLALSFGIGAEHSKHYGIDTPSKDASWATLSKDNIALCHQS